MADDLNPTKTETAPPATSVRMFTEAEFNDALTRVRREEKEKLYASLEARDKKVAKLEDEQKEIRDKLAAAEAGSSRAKDLEAQLAETNRKLQDASKAFEAQLDAAAEKIRKEMEAQFQKNALQNYREALVKSAGDEVIPELVFGDSKEEIDASFAKSKERVAAIKANAAQTKEKELREQFKGQLPGSEAPGNGTAGGTQNGNSTPLWKMSDKEWAEKREELKREAYQKAGLPMSTK